MLAPINEEHRGIDPAMFAFLRPLDAAVYLPSSCMTSGLSRATS